MGTALSAIELTEKKVRKGQDIVLRWQSNCDAKAKWEKDGEVLIEDDRISIEKKSKTFTLRIKEASGEDAGRYTLELWNREGKESGSAMVTILQYDEDWRDIDWEQVGKENEKLKTSLSNFTPSCEDATRLRFLLHGPVGAGKSSIINSISSVFQGRIIIKAGVEALSDKSHTTIYRSYNIKGKDGNMLPFVFNDIMGLEDKEDGGVLMDDIISALKGHVKDRYEFNMKTRLSADSDSYISNPTMSDKPHCLVSVIPANRIALLEDNTGVIKKMKGVRKVASGLGIPQVVFMTHVDNCCPLVKEDLANIYSSKRIKEVMLRCSNMLGVPMNCIFPLKNYHEEKTINNKMDCVILEALESIVHFADDYVSDL